MLLLTTLEFVTYCHNLGQEPSAGQSRIQYSCFNEGQIWSANTDQYTGRMGGNPEQQTRHIGRQNCQGTNRELKQAVTSESSKFTILLTDTVR